MPPSLTRHFYAPLEWQLSAALSRPADASRRRYCCDGILAPEWAGDYQPQHVHQTRQLRLRAWIAQGLNKGSGSSVQSLWPLTLKLGPQSYQAYLRGGRLEEFVPVPEFDDWILIAPED